MPGDISQWNVVWLVNLYDSDSLYAIQIQSADKIYEWLLNNRPDIVQRVPQKYISSYINQTTVILSNMEKKLADKHNKKLWTSDLPSAKKFTPPLTAVLFRN